MIDEDFNLDRVSSKKMNSRNKKTMKTRREMATMLFGLRSAQGRPGGYCFAELQLREETSKTKYSPARPLSVNARQCSVAFLILSTLARQ